MIQSALADCMSQGQRMDETSAKIVHALAQCNMNINAAAQKLHYHRNTIEYHITQLRKTTGLDPRNFFDLGELYTIAIDVLGDEYELL